MLNDVLQTNITFTLKLFINTIYTWYLNAFYIVSLYSVGFHPAMIITFIDLSNKGCINI